MSCIVLFAVIALAGAASLDSHKKLLPSSSITFTKYHSYLEIHAYLNGLQNNYPKTVKLHSVGKSTLGKDLTVVHLSTNHNAKKPAIFIDGGIHGRDWISAAAPLYIIKELAENSANSYLLEKFDWHILPLINPDGYEYSQTTDRSWKKNLATNAGSECKGVDLNRNFADHWGGLGSSSDPCSDVYKGVKPFSEPESSAVQKYLLSITDNAKLYITFHSHGHFILHPWGYGYELPEDAAELKELGDHAAAGIKSLYNTEYAVGSVTQLVDPAGGGSDDWAKSAAGFKYSYSIELPGGGEHGYDLPESEISKSVTEIFEGIKAFHDNLPI